ncbi:MAG: hypothetical protein H0U71_02585 [Gammaproteobacteria bacterium]|nr:hypothetical protein [Gammaproteobacteria bacterium]
MPKFRPYVSPFELLAKKIGPVGDLRNLYYKYNKFDDLFSEEGGDPRDTNKLSFYILGGFNPLLAMRKDFVDTFKPYKSRFYIARDFLQPFRGIGNILKGVFNILVSPVLFLANTFRYAYRAIAERSLNLFANNMAMNFARTGGGILDGITSLIRGVGQLVTTPLTWLIRMPLRGIITGVKGMPTVVDSLKKKAEKTEVLLKKENITLNDAIAIDHVVLGFYGKMLKGMQRGQKPGADTVTLQTKSEACDLFANSTEAYGNLKELERRKIPDINRYWEVEDGPIKRAKALAFLRAFTNGGANLLVNENDESQALLNGNP